MDCDAVRDDLSNVLLRLKKKVRAKSRSTSRSPGRRPESPRSSPRRVLESRGESLDREIDQYLEGCRAQTPVPTPSVPETSFQESFLVSNDVRTGGGPKVNLLSLPSRTAGVLVILAIKRSWTTQRLAQVAEYLLQHNLPRPTTRHKHILLKMLSEEEVTSLTTLAFNSDSILYFAYGSLMGGDAWRGMGAPDWMFANSNRQLGEIKDFSIKYVHHPFSLRGGSREGLPSLEQSAEHTVYGAVLSLPPQAVILAASHNPGYTLLHPTAYLCGNYVQKEVVAISTTHKTPGLSPSRAYIKQMVAAGHDVLPIACLDHLVSVANSRPCARPSMTRRHQSLVLSRMQ